MLLYIGILGLIAGLAITIILICTRTKSNNHKELDLYFYNREFDAWFRRRKKGRLKEWKHTHHY
jgi:hypothetical protein